MSDYMKEAERLLIQYENAYVAVIDMSVDQARTALLAHIQRGAVPDVDWLSNVIRAADGSHRLGAGALAEKIVDAMLAAAPAPDQCRDAAKMVTVHCTPTEHEGRIVYEHTSEPIPNADGFVLYAAPAPDRFRAAAKMMAVQPACMTCTAPAPAEVPMPDVFMYGVKEPDGGAWMQEVCVSTLKGDVDELVDDLNDGRDDADTRYTPVSLVTMEDAERYGAACRDAGEAAGYARGLAEAGDRIRRGRKILDAALRGEVKP